MQKQEKQNDAKLTSTPTTPQPSPSHSKLKRTSTDKHPSAATLTSTTNVASTPSPVTKASAAAKKAVPNHKLIYEAVQKMRSQVPGNNVVAAQAAPRAEAEALSQSRADVCEHAENETTARTIAELQQQLQLLTNALPASAPESHNLSELQELADGHGLVADNLAPDDDIDGHNLDATTLSGGHDADSAPPPLEP